MDTLVLPLKRSMQGKYMIEGKVNGTGIGFLIDSGADSIVLSNRLARKLNIELTAQEAATGAEGGNARAAKGAVDSVNLVGGLNIGAKDCLDFINHVSKLCINGGQVECDGLLGLGFIHGSKMIIDYRADKESNQPSKRKEVESGRNSPHCYPYKAAPRC